MDANTDTPSTTNPGWLTGATSVVFKLSLLLFLAGGAVVTFGQLIGVAVGSGAMVTALATGVGTMSCIVAGISGFFAFLLIYLVKTPPID